MSKLAQNSSRLCERVYCLRGSGGPIVAEAHLPYLLD